jgi:hypothetical protein
MRPRSGCCALTASGHAAALPSPTMKSRRRISDLPRLDRQPIAVGAACLALMPNLFCGAGGHLCPIASFAAVSAIGAIAATVRQSCHTLIRVAAGGPPRAPTHPWLHAVALRADRRRATAADRGLPREADGIVES